MTPPARTPRRLLAEQWPWLLGFSLSLLLDWLQPFALQQVTQYFYLRMLGLSLLTDAPLVPALSMATSATLVLLPWPLCRRQGAGTAFMICAVCMALPLFFGVLLLLNGYWFNPFCAVVGLWIGASLSFVRQLRQAQRTLLRNERHAAATLNAIADAVVNVTPYGIVRSMNPVAVALASPSLGQVGQHVSVAFGLNELTTRQLEQLIRTCADTASTLRAEQPLTLNQHQLRVTAGPIVAIDGQVDEVVLALTDITETVAAHQRLYHEATHDALTGLPNRSLLVKRIAEAISQAMQHDGLAAVLFVDIDHFNRINDSLGHHTGDEILQQTGRRLVEVIGHNSQVSRWGGDEYVILLEQVRDAEQITAIANEVLERTRQPLHINGLTLHVTCSVGISLTPSDSINVDELLAMADTAMARTKTEGEGGYRFFSSSMSLWSRSHIDIESDLRRALQNNEFELYYQPQVALRTGKLVGMEALLRWNRPSQGIVFPDFFVPIAESIGLINDIGIWAIHRATQQLREWQHAGLPVVPIAVNVSARQCLDHRITAVIADALNHTGIDPGLLKIELTETTAMNNVEHVASLLRSVNALGVHISVDDFGTGYSSLSFLKRFPISQLKIDRSFVNDITTDSDDAAIVSGTIALAHGLGIEVVAEGVETEDQLNFLAARGCDIGQGHYFAMALHATDARQWLTQPPRDFDRRPHPVKPRTIAIRRQ